jgi:hypothetical protein
MAEQAINTDEQDPSGRLSIPMHRISPVCTYDFGSVLALISASTHEVPGGNVRRCLAVGS